MTMMVLPRGKIVREGVNPSRIDLGASLHKLRIGSFSGYLHFRGQKGPGYILFVKGALVEVLWEEGGAVLRGYEAVQKIFASASAGSLELDIYALEVDLAALLCSLFHGDLGSSPRRIAEIDPEQYTAELKREGLSGFLRLYAPGGCTLIRYSKGVPTGFVLDGEPAIARRPDMANSVARMDGALIDFVWTPEQGEAEGEDLAEALDLGKLWARARARGLSTQDAA